MIEKATDNRWQALLMVAGGVLLSTMDSSMVNVALPEIMVHFGVEIDRVQLVVLVYLMVITSSLVLWGRITDRFGPIRVYLIGMTVFLTGALGCAWAPLFWVLICCRFLQAIGAAMIMAAGPALLKLSSPTNTLGSTLGLVGIATSCGLMSGPVVSGLLLQYASWRAIFLIHAPLAVLVSLFGFSKLLQLKDAIPSHDMYSVESADWQGGMVWTVLVCCYVLLLTGNGMISHKFLYALLVVLFAALVVVEAKVANPMLPLPLLTKRYYWTGAAAASLSFAALFMVIILIPFFLKFIQGSTPSRTGLTMMAIPISLVVVSPFSGWFYDRLGSARGISTAGLLLSCWSVFLLIRSEPDTSFQQLFVILALLGAGQSAFLSPNSASILTRVEDRFAGVTSGILATARNFGMLTGAGVATMSFSYLFGKFTDGASLNGFSWSQPHVEAFMQAQQQTLFIAMAFLLTAALCSLLRR